MKLIDKEPIMAELDRAEQCLVNPEWKKTIRLAKFIVIEAPTIDIDRPQGEWIEQEDDYYHYWECSECGMGVGLDDIRNFCPNCGARMKGADDE